MDESLRCSHCTALQHLGLETNATEDEIRDAYRVLVKVWHPDRFPNDQKLKDAAETKLKEINSAYVYLTSPSAKRAAAARTGDPSANAPARHRARAASAIPNWIPPFRFWPVAKIFLKFAALAVAILLGRYLWIAFDVSGSASPEVAQALDYGKESLSKGLEAPKQRFLEAFEQDLRRLGWHSSAAEPAVLPQAAMPAPEDAADARAQKTPATTPATTRGTTRATHAGSGSLLPYITVGLTKDEVIAQQGAPTSATENKLFYGNSELDFKNGALSGWRIRPASPLRVKLWPHSPVDPDTDHFAVGCSRDLVLVVQGTPTAFSEDKFEYGAAEVYFRNGRVVSWKNDPAAPPLKAR